MTGQQSFASQSQLKAAALLDMMKEHIAGEAGEDLKKKIGFVYQFNISPKKIGIDPEVYVVDLKNSKVTKGEPKEKPDAAFSFVDDDFVAVATGKLGPQMAFVRGKMKIKGSMAAANKFTPNIFPKPAKL